MEEQVNNPSFDVKILIGNIVMIYYSLPQIIKIYKDGTEVEILQDITHLSLVKNENDVPHGVFRMKTSLYVQNLLTTERQYIGEGPRWMKVSGRVLWGNYVNKNTCLIYTNLFDEKTRREVEGGYLYEKSQMLVVNGGRPNFTQFIVSDKIYNITEMGVKINDKHAPYIAIPALIDGYLIYEDPGRVFWSLELKTGQKRFLAKNTDIPSLFLVDIDLSHGLLTIRNPYKLHVFTKNSYFVVNHKFKDYYVYPNEKYMIIHCDGVDYLYNKNGQYTGYYGDIRLEDLHFDNYLTANYCGNRVTIVDTDAY
jgi:hypothetical protein